MRAIYALALAGLTTLIGVPSSPRLAAHRLEPTTRTVYVTVTDKDGMPVLDLTPADFTVKEGGKEREIVKVMPATARMHIALMVEERLLGDGGVRNGLFEFVKRMQPVSDTALIAIGIRNKTIVDYSNDLNVFASSIMNLSMNPPKETSVAEGILDIGKSLEKERPARPVVVVVAVSGGQSGGASANEVLNQLRQSGATMSAVTITAGESAVGLGQLGESSNREQVLGDGAKQSGGRRIEIPATAAVPKALQQIAGDLNAQYAIEYILPDGIKLDRRLNVNLKRRGASLRAPTQIPDR
jgi:VWFA-related protein